MIYHCLTTKQIDYFSVFVGLVSLVSMILGYWICKKLNKGSI